MAQTVSERSTCPRAQVGAVVVSLNKILGTGYNGAPAGMPHCDEVGCAIASGHCERCIHAEVNAVIQALTKGSVEGAVIYCTHMPCIRCSQILINVGIGHVVYESGYMDERLKVLGYATGDEYLAAGGVSVLHCRIEE